METPLEYAINHRLYDIEVIEMSPDVSFLVICPPAELSCAVPGQREILLQRGDLLSLPLQAFEMVHLKTYQLSIIQKYSRLSCILELDTVVANHVHREAFSSTELLAAKERLAKLHELTANLNTVWKGVRWLMDVISFARDRSCIPGLNMKEILEYQYSENKLEDDGLNGTKRQLLQPPSRDNKLVKSSPGRGSWPGPAISNSICVLGAEHSKSEQHLSLASASSFSSRYLSATSGLENASRKNSADSNYSHSGNSYYSAGENCDHILPRLPPSRSEDTLTTIKKLPTVTHRKRATTINNTSVSAASSPMMNIRASYLAGAITDSMHSLSSDSETTSCPVSTSTPNKPRITTTQHMTESKSMTDVKEGLRCSKQLFESNSSRNNYLQPNLPLKEVNLHIAEEEHNKSYREVGTEVSENYNPNVGSPKKSYNLAPAKSKEEAPASSSNAEAATIPTNSGIIQVYAAYDTGLASGTSLKLHVTTRTSAREVVDLVVKQLNMAVVLKGKDGPIYTSEKLDNFCLVAVIGARERCLRDDFKPLQLQNPWKKGKLYVRQKHDLLAAIEHSNRDAQLI